jgi:hypothetical protein
MSNDHWKTKIRTGGKTAENKIKYFNQDWQDI